MKSQAMKFAAATAVLVISTMVAQAQLLKPGEIVYSRAATVEGGNCDTAAVWAVGLDGSNDRRITGGFHPRISPDGRKILFKRQAASVSCSPFGGFIEWWIRDLATGVETAISDQQGYSFGHAFSPDTNRADRQITTNESGTFCQMNTDGANRTCFLSELAPIRGVLHLSVRGDDSLIVLQNSDPGTPQSGLWTLSYDRTNKQKIPNTTINDWTPDWSNDGQTIAYARSAGEFGSGGGRGAFYPYYLDNLFTVKPDGSNFTQLTFYNNLPQADGFSFSLVWTLDNQMILDAARLNGVAGIYKIAADGSGIQGRIPLSPGAIPDWVGGIVPAYGEKQIAAWGGGVAAGEDYTLVNTIGQAFAGQTSVGDNFSLQSGFWNSSQVPSAAGVSVGGRVLTADGRRGIRNVTVTLTGANGETRTALSTAFGYYRFADVPAGETYIISVYARRFTFNQPVQLRSITEETLDINFIAEPSVLSYSGIKSGAITAAVTSELRNAALFDKKSLYQIHVKPDRRFQISFIHKLARRVRVENRTRA